VDLKFESTRASLMEMLTRQVGVYEKEEHALRVHMKEEVRDKMQRKKGEATMEKREGVWLNWEEGEVWLNWKEVGCGLIKSREGCGLIYFF